MSVRKLDRSAAATTPPTWTCARMKELMALTMLGLVSFSTSGISVEMPESRSTTFTVLPEGNPCEGFPRQNPTPSGWLWLDCWNVWSLWKNSRNLHDILRDRSSLTAEEEQHNEGFPCEVQSELHNDGAGGRTMRYLADWIVAEELGCSWIGPQPSGPVALDDIPNLYCHSVTRDEELNPRGTSPSAKSARCSQVDWLEFFNLEVNMANRSETITTKQVNMTERDNIFDLYRDLSYEVWAQGGVHNLPWKKIRFSNHRRTGSRSLTSGDWNPPRQKAAQHVLHAFRSSYWQHSQPGSSPVCGFSSARLDVALHVRLGDRSSTAPAVLIERYFDLLEGFMASVSGIALSQGHLQPMFHIFSEVKSICPSAEDRTFQEFRRWPIQGQQVEDCLTLETPSDCPEKAAGGKICNPGHSGVFHVQDKPILLHVGWEVQKDLECMIRADGILTGCSTFGQIAGILSKGVKFFSTSCVGEFTAPHYKLLPPLATVEHGHLWVPISGSWQNPIPLSGYILHHAVAQLIAQTE